MTDEFRAGVAVKIRGNFILREITVARDPINNYLLIITI